MRPTKVLGISARFDSKTDSKTNAHPRTSLDIGAREWQVQSGVADMFGQQRTRGRRT
jgi:hypothetical protein